MSRGGEESQGSMTVPSGKPLLGAVLRLARRSGMSRGNAGSGRWSRSRLPLLNPQVTLSDFGQLICEEWNQELGPTHGEDLPRRLLQERLDRSVDTRWIVAGTESG